MLVKKEYIVFEIEFLEFVLNGFFDVDIFIDFDVFCKLNGELINWLELFNVFGKFKCILERCVKVFDDDRKVEWFLVELFVFVFILKDGILICLIG